MKTFSIKHRRNQRIFKYEDYLLHFQKVSADKHVVHFSLFLKTSLFHTSFKPHKTLRQLLVAPKDNPPPDQLAGTVYCLECEDCHKCYIGESARPLGKLIKEHITTRSSSISAVSEHLKTTKHHFDPDKVKILARERKDFSRKILEAIHVRKEKPALNREKGLDLCPVWDPVLID